MPQTTVVTLYRQVHSTCSRTWLVETTARDALQLVACLDHNMQRTLSTCLCRQRQQQHLTHISAPSLSRNTQSWLLDDGNISIRIEISNSFPRCRDENCSQGAGRLQSLSIQMQPGINVSGTDTTGKFQIVVNVLFLSKH